MYRTGPDTGPFTTLGLCTAGEGPGLPTPSPRHGMGWGQPLTQAQRKGAACAGCQAGCQWVGLGLAAGWSSGQSLGPCLPAK